MVTIVDIADTVFKCSCECGDELSVGQWGDGQYSFSIKEKTDYKRSTAWHEAVMSAKDVKKIVKLLGGEFK